MHCQMYGILLKFYRPADKTAFGSAKVQIGINQYVVIVVTECNIQTLTISCVHHRHVDSSSKFVSQKCTLKHISLMILFP